MRVLEKPVGSSYSIMGKKSKHKLRKPRGNDSDSSEDVSGRGCMHVSKSININTMKKNLSKQVYGECTGCAKNALCKKSDRSVLENLEGATSSDFIEEVEPVLWVCLQCGHQGCGRNSQEKHALKHFETPHSSQHNVVIETTTWTAWCYACDEEVLPDKHKRLAECMEQLKRIAGVPPPDATGKNGSASSGGASSCVESSLNKSRTTGCLKVQGLSNLGNTCFFNAVLQNLIQTYSLSSLLGDRKKGHPLSLQGKYIEESCSSSDEGENEKKNTEKKLTKELASIEVNINDPGPLTQALVVFLHDINSSSRTGVISPNALFGQVCKKAPRFKGMQQQDSHELLRYLLDNMKTEEIKRGQLGILKHFRLTENTNPKKVDEDVKTHVKVYGREIKHTFVECLFGGQLISTVVCEECKYISQILEPFLDLSLPVAEEKPQRPNQMHGRGKKDSVGDDELYIKPEDEVVSKYQMKKQKKAKKGPKKRGSAKGRSILSLDDGEKEEEEKGEKEEADEKEEAGEEKSEDHDEKYDASDADVEDNLESDTSRCYNRNISDSILDEQGLNDTLPKTADDISTVNKTDEAIPSTSFTFNTSIVNNQSGAIASSQSSLDSPILNGPIRNGVESEEISVTYTLTNGCLTEVEGVSLSMDHSEKLGGESVTKTGDDLENDSTLGDSVTLDNCINGSLANGIANGIDAVHIDNDINTGNDSLSDLTSGVSTLSLGGKSAPSCVSLTNGFSKLACNGDIRENGVNNEAFELDDLLESDARKDLAEQDVKPDIAGHTNVQYRATNTNKLQTKSWKDILTEGKRKSINTLAERYHPVSGECSIESCLHQFTAAELLTGNNKFGCKNCNRKRSNNNPNKEKRETVYSNANKWYLIFQPPAVLTLHLKRFEQVGYSSRKVNTHVDFPLVLDIAPYCSAFTQGIKPGQKKILYSLYGVVEHSGRLSSGHYTAYVKVRPNIGTLNNFLNKHHVRLKEYLQKYAERVANGDIENMDVSDEVNTESLVPPGRWYHISDSRVNEVTIASVERAQAYLLFYERIY